MGKLLSIVGQERAEDSATAEKAKPYRGRAAVITLGCAKNHVDSEVMLGVLSQYGYDLVNDAAEADVAIVNTCSFLQSAVQESIDCILDIAELKKEGRLRKLIVAGCLVSRYGAEITETLPEVDAFLSTEEITKVGAVASDGEFASVLDAGARPYFLYDDTVPRQLATQPHTAYVKISEGCNRPCTFCIIPKIRGPIRSRDAESVVREVEQLAKNGVREINLVAQDLTSYGKDIRGEGLQELLERLDRSRAVPWIRLLYAYPVGTESGLIESVNRLPSICNYYDIPLQHSSEAVLKRMQRPVGRYAPRSIVETIRASGPDIAIRTTFIVGFPGETEADIDDLVSFVQEGHFSSVGVFTYSKEAGTPAGEMKGQIGKAEAERRRARVMEAQQEVVADRNSRLIGKRLEVLIEGEHEETELLLSARAEFQAPEVDGTVMINEISPGIDPEAISGGRFGVVEITETAGYDLVGSLVSLIDAPERFSRAV